MTIKPVAYINVEERKLEWAEPITWHTPTIAQMDKIPLYTHLAKTLTDEEILECWNETHPAVVILNAELPLFARAILRKAQEK
jgi:hypothetical protein